MDAVYARIDGRGFELEHWHERRSVAGNWRQVGSADKQEGGRSIIKSSR